jgi:glycosyltransferase involved in cell wall biosynthesis
MNILVWSQYFWPESFLINDLVKRLAKTNQITVLTGKPNYPNGAIFEGYQACGLTHESQFGTDIYRVPILPRGKNSALRLAINYLSFIFSSLVCAPFVLRKKSFDVIYVYAPSPLLQIIPAIFISWLKRAPLVLNVQDLWPESLRATGYIRNPTVLKAVEHIVKWIYARADLILISSKGHAPFVERLTKERNKVCHFPNSTDDLFANPVFDPDDELAQEISKSFSIVFAGNLGHAQALPSVLEAAKLLREQRDIKFYLIGSGSLDSWISQKIEADKIGNVVLAGRHPAKRMPTLLKAASAALVSLNDDPFLSATLPSKVQAYLAIGVPVIAFMNGDGAHTIEEAQAGLSCPSENPQKLADTVLKLYNAPKETLDLWRENGRRYYKEHYDLQLLADRLQSHFVNVRKNMKKDV